jgi:hypothetical protein
VKALIDSGASLSFIDSALAREIKLPRQREKELIIGETVDGRPLNCGAITHNINAALRVNDSRTNAVLRIINCPHFRIILGMDWLSITNPQIDWSKRMLTLPATTDRNKNVKIQTISYQRMMKECSKGMTVCLINVVNTTPTGAAKKQKLPEIYREFSDVFSKERADLLPEHRKYDMKIELKTGSQPPYGPIYNLTQDELKALKEYLDENLAKGFIVPSKSPAGAPILFAKKKDGSLRLCVDYRKLNSITVKDRFPIPLINSLIDRLQSAKIFTKIDLRGAYNLVRIHEPDQWKTAFRTRYGNYEYRVMPFGLSNAPSVFQRMMQDLFQKYMDEFVVIYLDDILIFSKDANQHQEHVKKVLTVLKENDLFAKLEKCEFHTIETMFLGLKIGHGGLSMDPTKVQAILEWETPKTTKGLQRFLGFANYYRRFIRDYSKLILPLTTLLQKDHKFVWDKTCDTAFQKLKHSFKDAPVLRFPDFAKPFVVETDASDFALGAVLSQDDSTGLRYPIAFHSRKLDSAEINYDIHDKELLAIKDCFQVWRHYLLGSQHTVRVLTDHRNLEYFLTCKNLNRRQTRWALFFADYDFTIDYRPGKDAIVPDALSRREEFEPAAEERKPDNLLKSQLQFRVLVNAVTESTSFDGRANIVRIEE